MDITNKELFELLGERYARAYEMRKNGLTYKAIGINLGVGRERARQIIAISERKLRNRGQLDIRIMNVLRAYGYTTEKQVFDGIKNGSIDPYAKGKEKIQNYGPKTHEIVCKWFGLKFDCTKRNEKTIEKYITYLERKGYKVIKPA